MTPVCEKASHASAPRKEMQIMLRLAGGHGSVKERIRRASRLTGLSWGRAKNLWYADHRALVRPEELKKARSAALEALRHEQRRAAELLARLEAQEFHSAYALAFSGVAFGSHSTVES
jgi:uncharacterized membrane-anchored protein